MPRPKRLIDYLREQETQRNGHARRREDEDERGDAWEPRADGYEGDQTLGDLPGAEPAAGLAAFPLSALPAVAGDYARAAAEAIGCDVSYVALPLLVGLASAVGNSRVIHLKRGWTEPAVLWTVIVGESGTLKSPAAEAPLRPIFARQAEALQRYRAALGDHETDEVRYQADVSHWRRDRRGDPPERPVRPTCPRYWCSDTTVEALATRLQDSPRGLLLYRDELAGWLRSYDCYRGGRGGDVAHWLSMHAARPVLIDRKTGDRPTIHVPRAAVSISGSIQPEILRQSLDREHFDDGLAARLLLSMPERKAKHWTEYDIEPHHLSALGDLYDRLYALDLSTDAHTGEPCPVTVGLSPAAKDVWINYYDSHAAEMATMTGDLRAAWSKLEGYAARLTLLLHSCLAVLGEAPAEAIDRQSMEGGVELARWFGHEARRIYAVLSESPEEREMRELTELMQAKGGKITARELMHGSRRYRSDVATAETALNRLVELGRAQRETINGPKRGGWQSSVWRLT